jgi:Uma2 family endonuclease
MARPWHNGRMGAAALVSVEEYLSTSYDPDCDYVDGELEDRNVGELGHSDTQGNLYFFLRMHYRTVFVFVELRIRVSNTRYRVPDVCVTLERPREPVLTRPPFLCMEILSPEDRADRTQRKVADYIRMGVRYVWVIDPRRREAVIYTTSGMRVVDENVLRTSDPDIAVPFAEIFD